MSFADRLRAARKGKNLTQQELAKESGVAYRTLQNWENGSRRPVNITMVDKVASALGISTAELLDDGETFVAEAGEKYGSRGAKDAAKLLEEMKALFTNGEMKDQDMDAFMRDLQETYWQVKEINREKYNPNKNGKGRGAKKDT